MKLLIAYASTEGQTRKIARFIGDRLFDAGHSIELLPVDGSDDIALSRFDRVVMAASIHAGQYQRAMSEFAAAKSGELTSLPTLFLSVSLAAAGHDADDWKTLDRILADFTEACDWQPGQVAQIAGAYKPSEYDIFRRFVMRRIVAARDPDANLDTDHDYTDWSALAALVDTWMA
jgi:menaquinone-dependent protoporphyrinogen oxidase